jgi:hypothetical protein
VSGESGGSSPEIRSLVDWLSAAEKSAVTEVELANAVKSFGVSAGDFPGLSLVPGIGEVDPDSSLWSGLKGRVVEEGEDEESAASGFPAVVVVVEALLGSISDS